MSAAPTDNAIRCSSWSRLQRLDPIGTAGSYQGFLLIELPLPWPRDIGEIPEVAALSDILKGRHVRVQGLVPESSQRKAILYDNFGAMTFRGYARRSADVGADLKTAVVGLLEGEGESGGGQEGDLLLCTHGKRDRCCGSLGTTLALDLARDSDKADLLRGQGVRLWRTSHTGGHRFAPTLMLFPEGTMWAYADESLVERLLRRDGDVTEVIDRYRGCAGLASPGIQALEREVLREVGWDLLDWGRSGAGLDDERYQLEVTKPDGSVDRWTGHVGTGRTLPLPDCGQPVENTSKSVTELQVSNVALA